MTPNPAMVAFNWKGVGRKVAVTLPVVAFVLVFVLYSSSVHVHAFVTQPGTTDGRIKSKANEPITRYRHNNNAGSLSTLFARFSPSSQSSWDNLSTKLQSTDVDQLMQQQQQRIAMSESQSPALSTSSSGLSSVRGAVQSIVEQLQQQVTTGPLPSSSSSSASAAAPEGSSIGVVPAKLDMDFTLPTLTLPQLPLPASSVFPTSVSVDGAITKMQEAIEQVTTTLMDNESQQQQQQLGLHLKDVVVPFPRIIDTLWMYLQDHPLPMLAISAWISYALIQFVLQWGQPPPPSRPYPLEKYDPFSARLYFDARPRQVATRATTIFIKSMLFALKLVSDKLRGEEIWVLNQERRGMELATLLTELGPTFIKIGQSLSIRSDLLSPPYIRGLASLQDQVPAFDSTIAQRIIEDEWGVNSISEVLDVNSLPSRPVAAASLGQVYKVTLQGKDVAIKVQRPGITTQIALDMHLLREFAPLVKRVFNLNTDTVGTVDAWGKGFVDELDYMQEARNGEYFLEQIQKTPLKDVVLAPQVLEEYSSSKILVTEWIDGQRLDKSKKEDVTILCSVCMNTYLSMLLEMGILHCDPHPGNLLRTPDGRLAILDWGMVTSIPPQLQLTLVEHMAHLTSGDYAEVPRDLLLLGFVPEDKADVIEDSGVVEVLANIYGAWTSGGGLATINANDVLQQMQDLAGEKGNLFRIPPYFAYIAKSFSVLEGIGLSNDPKYSIINECLPYVSNRLLTDKATMGNAVNSFVYGPDKGNIDTRLVDYKRVEQLVTGFGSFTATVAADQVLDGDLPSRTAILESVADQLLDIVFTEEETPVQEIVNEQLAKILAASTRTLWSEARLRSGVLPNGRTVLGTLVDPLGFFQTSPLVNANYQDKKTVDMTMKLLELLRPASRNGGTKEAPFVIAGVDISSLDAEEVRALARILTLKFWERRVALVRTGNRFWNKFLQLTANRLENGDRIPIPERRATVGISNGSLSSLPKSDSGGNSITEDSADRQLEARKP